MNKNKLLKNRRHRIGLLLVCLFTLSLSQYGAAQVVQDQTLCYDLESNTRIRVVEELDTETLDILDKLLFYKENYKQSNTIKYETNVGWSQTTTLTKHSHLFPKWYVPPIKLITDESGTKSYFEADNKYLKDGWAGSRNTSTEHGEYVKDKSSGERYLYHPHTKKSKIAHQSKEQRIEKNGIKGEFQWYNPNQLLLQRLENDGYIIVNLNNTITATKMNHIIVWLLAEYIIVERKYEGGGSALVKEVKTEYTYNEVFNEYLMDLVTIAQPSQFTNGDCYTKVETINYSNFSDCSTAIRSSVKFTESSQFVEVYPNPTLDILNIKMQKTESASELRVSSVDGQQLIFRKIPAQSLDVHLNVESLPTGIYLLRIESGENTFTKKIVKK